MLVEHHAYEESERVLREELVRGGLAAEIKLGSLGRHRRDASGRVPRRKARSDHVARAISARLRRRTDSVVAVRAQLLAADFGKAHAW